MHLEAARGVVAVLTEVIAAEDAEVTTKQMATTTEVAADLSTETPRATRRTKKEDRGISTGHKASISPTEDTEAEEATEELLEVLGEVLGIEEVGEEPEEAERAIRMSIRLQMDMVMLITSLRRIMMMLVILKMNKFSRRNRSNLLRLKLNRILTSSRVS